MESNDFVGPELLVMINEVVRMDLGDIYVSIHKL